MREDNIKRNISSVDLPSRRLKLSVNHAGSKAVEYFQACHKSLGYQTFMQQSANAGDLALKVFYQLAFRFLRRKSHMPLQAI